MLYVISRFSRILKLQILSRSYKLCVPNDLLSLNCEVLKNKVINYFTLFVYFHDISQVINL